MQKDCNMSDMKSKLLVFSVKSLKQMKAIKGFSAPEVCEKYNTIV